MTRTRRSAAAFKSLRNYASPELLPLVNKAVVNEMHIAAMFHAYILFEALADASSVPAIKTLLRRVDMPEETLVTLIHTAIRIGDASVVPELQFLAANTESAMVQQEALAAIDLFVGPPEVIQTTVAAWPAPEVVYIDTSVVVPPPPAMSVSISADGTLMGAHMQVGDMMFGAGGVSVEVSAGVQVEGSANASCCIQGAYFQCAGPDAAMACGERADTSGCVRDTSMDATCPR